RLGPVEIRLDFVMSLESRWHTEAGRVGDEQGVSSAQRYPNEQSGWVEKTGDQAVVDVPGRMRRTPARSSSGRTGRSPVCGRRSGLMHLGDGYARWHPQPDQFTVAVTDPLAEPVHLRRHGQCMAQPLLGLLPCQAPVEEEAMHHRVGAQVDQEG